MTPWRLTLLHKDIEAKKEKALEAFKIGLRRDIYILTQTKHAVGNKHL